MSRESSISEGTKALSHVSKTGTRGEVSQNNQPYLYGRVVSIVLSPDDPLFIQFGSLEVIQFEPIENITTFTKSGDINKNYIIAYKFYPSVKTPIINEIVPLYNAPDILVQLISGQFSQVFYYGNPVSIYTSIEHNAAPDNNTQQNLNNNQSSQNKIASYQGSTSGLPVNTPGTDTILSKTQIKFGDYFTERGVRGLLPLEGDYKLEGRFGHSIRFGGTPSGKIASDLLWKGSNIGSPLVIIRNGSRKIDSKANISAIAEDINLDGSSMYMFSDQTVELLLASNNFDSYNESNDNASSKSSVVVNTPQKQSVSQSANSTDAVTAPIEVPFIPVSNSSMHGGPTPPSNDLVFVPDNEDDLNFVQVGEDIPVPLTQGVILNNFNSNYKFVPGTNAASVTNPNVKKAPTLSLSSVNAIAKFAGTVNSVPLISRNGKALVDLLALTEGTMGQGNFNGYDIIVRGGLIPGFDTLNSSPPHPNILVNIPEYGVKSTAAGRYQFIIGTWNKVMGQGTLMSRFNQDLGCWRNILNSANVPTDLIAKIDTDRDSFNKVIDLMAYQWASLPTIKDPKGLNKQAGRFTFYSLYTYFLLILSKY